MNWFGINRDLSEEELELEREARSWALNKVKETAIAGAAITLVLVGTHLWLGAGASVAFLELKKHILYVHPVLWALTLFAVSCAVLAKGGPSESDVNSLLTVPTLHFIAHVFGVALGALVVIALYTACTGGTAADYVLIGMVFILSLLNASLAQLGLAVAIFSKIRMLSHVRRLCLVMAPASAILFIQLAKNDKPTEIALPELARALTSIAAF